MLLALLTVLLPTPALSDEPTSEEPHTTDSRPVVILVEAGLGGPVGLMGGRVGYKQWEVGGGLGATGYQVSGQWKHYWKPFDSTVFSFPVGVGPSFGLSGEAVGIERDWEDKESEEPALLFASWLNAEVSTEWRARWGGVWRWTAGAAIRAYQNQSQLCDGVEPEGDGSFNACYSQAAFPSSPIVASFPALPYLAFSYGYAF